jgi:putative transposase
MMETFRHMVNDCLRVGLANDVSTMKKLSKLCYPLLSKYDIVSYYKLHAISKAAGILATRKKSIRRGHLTKEPYMRKPGLVSSYGFKIVDGVLKVPLAKRKYFDIQLNNYIKGSLSDPALKVRSFTLTADTLGICVSKEISEIKCFGNVGVDRNLENLTVGNDEQVTRYDLSKAVKVAENTRSIIRSFKRNDVRMCRKIASKYGRRRTNRIKQMMHNVSKTLVGKAVERKTAITFEDIRFIRRMYQSGNGQGRNYRSRLNGWSFAEIKRQIEYKAAWTGIPTLTLTKGETRGTSSLCPRCGERLQVGAMKRMLYCENCRHEKDRDIVAALNIAYKGRSRFERSQGAAGEAMKGNPMTTPVLLRVDAAKLTCRRKPIS